MLTPMLFCPRVQFGGYTIGSTGDSPVCWGCGGHKCRWHW